VFYERYAKTEGISIEEAQKRVSEHDVKAFQKKAKEYVKNKDFSPEANEELKLYNATMRINRLELLKAEINLHLTNLTEENNKEITDHLEKLGKTEYARQAGILDTELRYSKEGIKAIVNSDYKYGNFSKTLWTNQKALMNTIEVMLRRSIIQGGNSTELVGRLRKQFDVGVYEAKRLLVTEAARVQGDVQIDSMEQAGYDEYVYISEPTACDICKPLDGQHFKIKDREVGVNYYPMHPFCKCSSAAYYDSEKLDKEIAEYRKARGLDNNLQDDNKGDIIKEEDSLLNDIYKGLEKNNAKEMFGEKYFNDYKDFIKQVEDKRMLKLFKHLSGKINYNPLKEVRAYASGSTVQINKGDFEGKLYGKESPKGLILFHENGHALDYLGFEILTGKTSMPNGTFIKKKLYGRTYEIEERMTHASSLPKYKLKETINKDIWTYINGDLPNLESLGKKPRKKVEKEIWEQKYKELSTKIQNNKSRVIKDFRNIARESEIAGDINYLIAISDMFESTGWFGEYPIGFGHGKKYWKNLGTVETEFFAHAQEMLVSPKHKEIFEKIFPNALKVYETIIDDIIQGVEKNDD
jgi:SPP1 gp7 family putative phage head morphogenesis protein